MGHYLVYLSSPRVEAVVLSFLPDDSGGILTAVLNGAALKPAFDHYAEAGASAIIKALGRVMAQESTLVVEFKSISGNSLPFGAPVIGAPFEVSLCLVGRAIVSRTADVYTPGRFDA